MIGLDTNILVRYVTRDDAAMAARAEQVLRTRCTPAEPGFVNHIVLCELAWVLESAYRYRRAEIAALIDGLCRTVELRVQDADAVRAALADFRAGRADFADCLLGRLNLAHGCTATYTLDRAAATLPSFAAA